MSKQSGLGDQLFFGGYDLGGDVNAIAGITTPRNTLPSTGITVAGMERMYGTRDGAAEFSTYFNPSVGQQHKVLSVLPTTDVGVMYLRGTTRGNQGIGLVGKQIDYAPSRGDDGSLTISTSVQANAYGLDWGQQLTAGKQTDASAASSTGVDLGVLGTAGSTAFGFQAYLQVFSIGSGTPTVKIQSSSDNGSGDAFSDLTDGSFGAVTAPSTVRIQSSSATLSVERYLRVVTTGTFTNLVFAVVVNRNEGTRAI